MQALPAELLEHIAESLNCHDVASFRLTSRTIHHGISLKVFASKFFAQRVFAMGDRESMWKLRYLSAHPVYGKALKEIRLCASLIHKSSRSRELFLYRERCRREIGYYPYIDTSYEALDLNEPDHDFLVDSLTIIFANLMRANNIPAIIIQGLDALLHSDSNVPSHPMGYHRKTELLTDDMYHQYSQLLSPGTSSINEVIKTIFALNFPVQYLELGAPQLIFQLEMCRELRMHEFSHNAFSQLKQLFLTSHFGGLAMRWALSFLHLMPALEYLSLAFAAPDLEHDDFAEAFMLSPHGASHLALPKLWGLELVNQYVLARVA